VKSGPPLSGPDLSDAFDRLRPEFLASFIAKPQAWDPVAPMPGYGLEPGEVGKLVAYLRLLSEEGHDAKAR
jgi:cytochrome c1